MVLTADKGVAMVVVDREEYSSQVRGVTTSAKLQDPPNRSHKQVQEQVDCPAKIHQGRGLDG